MLVDGGRSSSRQIKSMSTAVTFNTFHTIKRPTFEVKKEEEEEGRRKKYLLSFSECFRVSSTGGIEICHLSPAGKTSTQRTPG